MPAGGPIDPEKLLEAIQAPGSDWSAYHLTILDGTPPAQVDRWPAVEDGAWGVSASEACRIDRDTFDCLRGATLSGLFVIVDSSRFEVVAVTIDDVAWCALLPA